MGGMRGVASLMTAATMSEGHTDVPSQAMSEGSPGTNLIGPGAEDLDENCLVRAQTLHCLLQLPGVIFTGAVQKGQSCLLEVSTQLTLEHFLQVL